jgi:hypothetical protein
VYAPNSENSEEEIEQFYQQLQEVISEITLRKVLLVIGDFKQKKKDFQKLNRVDLTREPEMKGGKNY